MAVVRPHKMDVGLDRYAYNAAGLKHGVTPRVKQEPITTHSGAGKEWLRGEPALDEEARSRHRYPGAPDSRLMRDLVGLLEDHTERARLLHSMGAGLIEAFRPTKRYAETD